ncbi:jg11176 [Pararge aegeria aegeria]|uniref:Jg11176 protein n=4 Tax=Pararge aegeria TaxID=116150 RepID=A0A8S4RKU2_9NEOP|nr:jg11176 [Pararge aegeria aegeria]
MNSPFGQPESTIFSGAGGTPAFTKSVFSSSKPDSTVNDNPFKGQSSVTSTPYTPFPLNSNASPDKPIPQVTSSLFGLSSTNVNHNNSPFSTKPNNNTTACKTPVASSPQSTEVTPVGKDEKEFDYYNNLRGLNESVSAWIKKHVEETPLCILSPIFKDYENHLKNIQDEYDKIKKELSLKNISDTKDNNTEPKSPIVLSDSPALSNSVFSLTSSTTSPIVEKTHNFTFGINPTATTSTNSFATTVTPSTGFSFGIKPSSSITSPFASNPTSIDNNGSTPFSFGIGKPFAFNTNIKKSDEPINEGVDNEDEPPKVEYTPIAEENSVYDRKCKVFVKKDGNFVDKGVGTLYIKKIEETEKYQLLVRANTALGNILINLILSSSLPTQRMGKNNVMMVCIPTPDAKPQPTSILIRVKTSEDADELLETLNKFKA